MIGSATPQNTNPIPIPAENSIENQERLLNSGFSWSWPSLISPNLLKQRYAENNNIAPTDKMYIHPKWVESQSCSRLKKSFKYIGNIEENRVAKNSN